MAIGVLAGTGQVEMGRVEHFALLDDLRPIKAGPHLETMVPCRHRGGRRAASLRCDEIDRSSEPSNMDTPLDTGRRLLRRAQGRRREGRRASDREPPRGWIPALTITLAVAALDWGTKAWVAASVPLGGFVEIWPDRVALWHVRNRAMILGLYGDLPLAARKGIALVAALVAFLLLFQVIGRGHRLRPQRRPWAWLFVGLAFGGMLGNLGERLVHWGVTDFLSLRWGDLWLPPGNIADLALFLSIPLAVVVILFELEARAQRRSAAERRALSGDLPTPSSGT
jgi:lipoprotein signal peptidase